MARLDVGAAELARAVEAQHGGVATFAQSAPVRETHDGQTVWEGVVHVFDLEGCEKTNRAYAWSSGSVHTALDIGPIRSPSSAVNAIVADMIRQSRLAFWGRGQQAAAA